MTYAWLLGQRALREAWRTPDALLPTLFIPLFFLVVNTGQAAKIFPGESTEFLNGQGYGAFQLPVSLLLAASFGTAALFLVEEIEGGYFDKLRAVPIPRTAIVLGRLIAEFAKGLVIATAVIALGMAFGIEIASGPLGFVLLVLLTALWSVVFLGFLQIIALKTRSAAATNSASLIFFPLLFLTPNFVPRELLTRPMEIAATLNPVTYVMEGLRSLILQDLDWGVDPARLRRRDRARRADAGAQRAHDQPLRLEELRDQRGGASGAVALDVGRARAAFKGGDEPVGDRLRRGLGVVDHPARAVALEPVPHVEALLEVALQRRVEERALGGGELHARGEAAVRDGDVARGQLAREVVDVADELDALRCGHGRRIDPRPADHLHAQVGNPLARRRIGVDHAPQQAAADARAADADEAEAAVASARPGRPAPGAST